MKYEDQLEQEIDRALKGLPELRAPAGLVSRVTAAIERRQRLPWYRQAWQAWPIPLRVASFTVLAAMFGGLCLGGWQVAHAADWDASMRSVSGWFSGFSVVLNGGVTLLSALMLAVKQMSTGVLMGCFAVVLLAYVMCVGMGTMCVRMGLLRR